MNASFAEWVGREERREDVVDSSRASALSATLSAPGILKAGDRLPPLFHWIYFWEHRTPAETGSDGHGKKGGFLPPISAPRRMWASGKIEFLHDICIGDQIEKRSTISDIVEKDGRSGALTFVNVQHELTRGSCLCLREQQVIVYRGQDRQSSSQRLPDTPRPANFNEKFAPDEITLFRYSALTLNSHRIHYDYPYATDIEGYEGLVVHGPLQATLLARLAERVSGEALCGFEFRGVAPAFCGELITLNAEKEAGVIDLWAAQDGAMTMKAKATFSRRAEG